MQLPERYIKGAFFPFFTKLRFLSCLNEFWNWGSLFQVVQTWCKCINGRGISNVKGEVDVWNWGSLFQVVQTWCKCINGRGISNVKGEVDFSGNRRRVGEHRYENIEIDVEEFCWWGCCEPAYVYDCLNINIKALFLWHVTFDVD